jgi:hypothetical protein
MHYAHADVVNSPIGLAFELLAEKSVTPNATNNGKT